MKTKWRLLLLSYLVLVYGCATTVLKSSGPQPVSQNITEQQVGALGYFLPKASIRVQIKPKEPPATPATKPPATQEPPKKEAQKTAKAAEGSANPEPPELELTISTELIPDPECFYTLMYEGSSWAHDNVTVTLSKEGLLQRVQVTTEDKTPEIVVKIAEIAKEIIKLTVLGPMPVPKVKAVPETPKRFVDAVFDPCKLLKKGKPGEGEGETVYYSPDIKIWLEGPAEPQSYSKSFANQKGVYYRPLLPYTLTVKQTGKEKIDNVDQTITYVKNQTVFLPNFAPVLALDITGAALVKKTTNLAFTDGLLTSFNVEKPSEILAGLNILPNIIKAMLALPTEMIQLKIDYSKKYTEMINQQKEELKAKQALLEELQQEREKAKEKREKAKEKKKDDQASK